MSAYRAALRVARRDALRAKGRTALVVAMIGVPVLAIVALAILVRTTDLTPAERAARDMGRADATVQAQGRDPARVRQALIERLGPDVRVLEVVRGGTRVTLGDGHIGVFAIEVDLRDRLAEGLMRFDGGRRPAAAGEVAVSASLRRLGFTIGTDLPTAAGPRRVVGYVTHHDNPKGAFAQALPGSLVRDGRADYLVAGDSTISDADVRALNALDLAVVLRGSPDTGSVIEDSGSSTDAMVTGLIVAMIILEVTLLAGPAFAVGIRRQRRLLALVAASGGQGRHLKAIVLFSGALLGGAAGVLGTAAGFGGALIGKALIERYGNTVLPGWDIPWSWIAATVAVAVLSGLAAAYVPARQAARTNVVAALAGRRDEARTARGLPVAGGVLVGCGIAASAFGMPVMREGGAVLGTILIICGSVLLVPATVGLAGRLARLLPLPLRLAVRDADRNRGRTAPAVAAIMAAVAGITVLAIGSASDFAQNRLEYVPSIPMGSTTVHPLPADRVDRTAEAVRSAVPGAEVIRADRFADPFGGGVPRDGTVVDHLNLRIPDTCAETCGDTTSGLFGFEYLIGGPEVGRFVLGRDDPAVTAALRAGKAVVFAPDTVANGRATFDVDTFTIGGGGVTKSRPIRVPAVQATATSAPVAIFPAGLAATFGLRTEPAALLVPTPLSPQETERAEKAVAKVAGDSEVYTERGFHDSYALILILLGSAGAIMVLGGSLISTGLSAADARPDLATLAAIGARPRTRRLLLMGQAAFVALLGCWLGILAGLLPGIAVAFPLTEHTGEGPPHGVVIDIPWLLLTGVGLGVPLLAVLVIGATTRSRLPMSHRMAG